MPNGATFLELNRLTHLAEHHRANISDLAVEIKQLQRPVERKKNDSEFTRSTLLDKADMLQIVQ